MAKSEPDDTLPFFPVIAVAQPVSPETVAKLLNGPDVFSDGGGQNARLMRGPGIEDFPADMRYQACLMPSPTGRNWLGAVSRLNCNFYIEAFPELCLGDLAPLRAPTPNSGWDLVVCLSTQSAYQLPLARKFVTALRRRHIVDDNFAMTLEMVVQEAFSNSILHGNLELNTSGHLSMERFEQLDQITRSRLRDPTFGRRAVVLAARAISDGSVEIAIHDQGPGFEPPTDDQLRQLPGRETTFGRGLPLIRSLCKRVTFERGGRSIILRLRASERTAQQNIPVAPIDQIARLPQGNQIDHSREFGQEESRNATILIADDTMISREIVASYLRSEGYNNLVFARDGEDTLDQVRRHTPDLIILDIMMPGLDGFEICKRLRADPDYAEVPIIALTALEEDEGRTRIFQDGATDLILKPLNKAELLARVRIHLENRLLVKQLRNYWERTRSELVLARDMQELLIPRPDYYRTVGNRYNLSISATFQMSSELGGDIWGLEPLDDDRLAVYLVDFAGHGLGAALNTFRLHSLMWSENDDEVRINNPGAYLSALNRQLKRLLPVGQFASMLYGIIDRKNDTFRYASAASTAPLIGLAGGGDCRFLDGSGVPLGITRQASYDTREVAFGKNSFLMLYSDALTETALDDGGMLEGDRLMTLVHNTIRQPGATRDLASRVTDYFLDHSPAKLRDDFTLVTLQSQN